jgi:hypothetical protein
MLSLSGEAFKMWVYFNKNQNNYSFSLSRAEAIKSGIGSASSYTRAFAELVKKGYLIETSKGHYTFNEFVQYEEKEKQ